MNKHRSNSRENNSAKYVIRNSDLSSSDDAPIFTNIQLKTHWADTTPNDGFLGPFNYDTVDACPPTPGHFNPLYISHELKPPGTCKAHPDNCCIYPSESGLTTGDCTSPGQAYMLNTVCQGAGLYFTLDSTGILSTTFNGKSMNVVSGNMFPTFIGQFPPGSVYSLALLDATIKDKDGQTPALKFTCKILSADKKSLVATTKPLSPDTEFVLFAGDYYILNN